MTRRVVLALAGAILTGVVVIVATQTFSVTGRIGVAVGGLITVCALIAIIAPHSPIGRVLLAYERAIDAMSQGLGWVAKWLVPACVTIAFVNVLLRYLGRFQHRALASNRYVEMQWMIFGAIFLTAFPYVLKHGINVRVDFIFTNFSRRWKALIDFAGHIVALVPYCLLAIWANWDNAVTSVFQKGQKWETWRVWEVWEQSPDANGLPRAPIKVLLLLGFVFLLLQTVAELVKLGGVLGEQEDVVAPELHEEPLRVE